MKKTLLTLSAALFTLVSFAQQTISMDQDEPCGTMSNYERMKKQDPGFEKRMQSYEQQLQQWIASQPEGKFLNTQGTIIIPTVVHIVWNTSAENVSNTVVNGLMQSLNEDYGRTNPDASTTPAVWQPIAVNTGVQFCLAQRDPSNAPTTGIERRQTTVTSFTTNDFVKFTAQGGLDIWDATQYFNIWLCDLTSGLLGYGEFPTGTPTNTFGNVTDYSVAAYGNWVGTHEGGHCFNLRHIWGDENACTGSDLCADTPNQAGATSTPCPTYPALDACATVSPGKMFMNYMDYGGNACKNLFTANQSGRINAVLNVPPYNGLVTSIGCLPVNLVSNDAGNTAIITPNGLLCTTTFAPVVTLRNWGNNALTSCVINYRIDANPNLTYNWSGNLASLQMANVTLPSMTTTAGNHTFTAYTTLPNTVPDGNTTNDTANSAFNIIPLGQPIPFFQGFEGVTFPPAGWTLGNPDASVTWARTTGASTTGVASMWFNSIQYPCNGCIDIMQTPNLDFTPVSSPQVTFQVAYRMLSDPNANPNWSDSLRVDVSTNCGQTWTNLYFKYSTNLTTIVPTFSTVPFVPGPNNWRLETISLTPYNSFNNVLLRWKVSSDYENNLYIDDINITGLVGVEEIIQNNLLHVYPNPSNGQTSIEIRLPEDAPLKLSVLNMLGEVVFSAQQEKLPAGTYSVNFDGSNLAAGVYMVKADAGSRTATLKMIIEK